MTQRKPTYNFAKYVYGEQSKNPPTKEYVDNRKYFRTLNDEELKAFFVSCHDEWLSLIERYLDRLCESYHDSQDRGDEGFIKRELKRLYEVAIMAEPRLTVEKMEEVKVDEFENWAARVYILTMITDFDEIRIGRLILTFTGIFFLKKFLSLNNGTE